jgi:phage portal protein BeeE
MSIISYLQNVAKAIAGQAITPKVVASLPAVIPPLHQSLLKFPNDVQTESKGSSLWKLNYLGLRTESKNYTFLYDNSSWVSNVIDIISAAGSKKFHIARKDGKPVNPQDQKVIMSFLNEPNLTDTFLSFFRQAVTSVLLYGSVIIEFHVSEFDKAAFSKVVKKALPQSEFGDMAEGMIQDTIGTVPEMGFPVYLSVLPFDQMVVKTDVHGAIIGYEQYTVQGTLIPYNVNEIIQIFHPAARDKVYGNSPIDGLLEVLFIDSQKDHRQLKILTNETIVNKFVTLPAGTSDEVLQKKQREIDEYYSTRGSTSDVMVMSDDMKITVLNEGTKEGDFLQLGQQIRDRVLCKYFVPIGILDSEGTSSTHSQGVDSLYRGFVEIAVRPVVEHVATMLNRYLMPHFGPILGQDYTIILDLLDGDDMMDQETMFDMTLRNASRSINEVRLLRGEQPIDDGDVPLIYTTTGATTLDAVLNPPEPPAPIVHAPMPIPPNGKPVMSAIAHKNGQKP